MKKILIIGLSTVAGLLFLALVFVIVYSTTVGREKYAFDRQEDAANASAVTAVPSELASELPTSATLDEIVPTQPRAEEPTQPATQAPTEKNADEEIIPDELSALLKKRGVDSDELKEQSISQIVTVVSSGTDAKIDFWYKSDGAWMKDADMTADGHVGREGVTEEMSEYVSATPAGFFPITEAFYIYEKPDTGLDTFEITYDTYWVDDPDSDYYNQRVDGSEVWDWSSAEHMIDYDVYEYGFVIGYNLACEKGKGSAIFFHLGSSTTGGCVSASESAVLSYLAALSADANPYILIV